MPVVLEEHKLAYFNVPKAASTSVKGALHHLEAGKPFRREDYEGRHIHQVYQVRLPVTARTLDELETYWKFAVVRDPIRRVLSAYANRIRHHRDLHRMPYARLRALRRGLSLSPTLESFIERLERYRDFSYSVRTHTDPLNTFLGPDLSRFDAVYRTDDLGRLADDLSARVGRRVEMPREQTGGEKIEVGSLSQRAFDKLRALTAGDYAMLGGLYEPPVR